MQIASRNISRPLLIAAILIIAAIPFTLLAMSLDERTFNGINIWIKPLKFEFSTALHLLTLVVLARLLPTAKKPGLVLLIFVWLCALSGLLEIALISLQAGRGIASHFNVIDPVNRAIYISMGVGAVCLLLPAFYIGAALLKNRPNAQTSAGLHFSAGLGLLAGATLTLLFAGYMSSQYGHWVGESASDAAGLPLVGWSRTVGDLRVPHFFATHLMQVLPVTGWLADRLFSSRRKLAVVVVFLTMGGIALFTFWQALQGNPFIR